MTDTMTMTMTMTVTATVSTPVPGFLDGFARIHAAMRRDAARFPRAIARATSPAETAAVRRWFCQFRSMLVQHHEREDTLVWPELVRRDASFADVQPELFADHHALDVALADAEAALDGQGDALGAAERLAEVLVDHLAREEAAAFPRLASCFTAEEWEPVERRIMKDTSFGHLAFEVPWVLDGLSADELDELKASAPLSLRALHRLVFAPRYERIAAPLLAVA